MKTVNKSVLIWYSADEMFALVTDIPSYCQFLPWCNKSRIVEAAPDGVTAELGIHFGGISQTFVTRNSHVAGREVAMKLVKGPFSRLDGLWKFIPLGDAAQRACRVEFQLQYDFENAALSALVGPVFDHIAGTLVDAFVKRAEEVYGAKAA